jgi:tight adherence protein C
MTPLIEIVVELLIFSAVALMTVTVMREVERIQDQRRRLGEQNIGGQGRTGRSAAAPLMARRISDNAFSRWILSSTSISDSQERQKLRQALVLAGFDNPNAPILYVIGRFCLAVLLPVLYIVMQFFSAKPVTGFGFVIWPLALCGIGLLAPGRILTYLAGARQAVLEGEFPDALDLMVVCVEAGLSLDSAFIRVGQEITKSHPQIASEFERVSEQLRAGRSRPDALRAMADRTGVNAIKSFVALLIQTEMLGASIAQTLRTFSSEMRETRFIKAEEKALRIPVLITIPLVVCILPVICTALLLPAAIDVVRTLMPALTGQHGG